MRMGHVAIVAIVDDAKDALDSVSPIGPVPLLLAHEGIICFSMMFPS